MIQSELSEATHTARKETVPLTVENGADGAVLHSEPHSDTTVMFNLS